ncbi:hypothetical protein [Bradyrhizobium genosp. P]|uniref:hypothetical protein n=1 Tax=Bradyrhizobium genosp. P TaxID=83641 RepID=UPI003CEE8F7D
MAEHVTDPKVTTVNVKPLGSSAAREIGTFSLKTKGPTPQEVTGKYVVVWEKVGSDWKLAARHLERREIITRVSARL